MWKWQGEARQGLAMAREGKQQEVMEDRKAKDKNEE